jgi:hypothetical protein
MRWYHLILGMLGVAGVLWDAVDILSVAIGFSVFVKTGQLLPQNTDSAVRGALLRWVIIGLPSIILIRWGFFHKRKSIIK